MITATQPIQDKTHKTVIYTIPIFIGIERKVENTPAQPNSQNHMSTDRKYVPSPVFPRPTKENPWANQGVELKEFDQYKRTYEIKILPTSNGIDSTKRLELRIREQMINEGLNGQWYSRGKPGTILATYYAKP